MAEKKFIIALDLDGILATRDIAKDVFKKHFLGEDFERSSNDIAEKAVKGLKFDGKYAYPGQTLEYMMNKHAGRIPIGDIREVAGKAKLMRGAKRFVEMLRKNPRVADIYVVTTTYKPAADIIAGKVGIKPSHVIATELHVDSKGIIQGVNGEANGGMNKAKALDRISRSTGVPIKRFVAVGDSITDIGMVRHVNENGGLAIGFNSNPDLIRKKPDLIVAGKRLDNLNGLIKTFMKGGKEKTIAKAERSLLGYRLSMRGPYFVIPVKYGWFLPKRKEERAIKVSGVYRKKTRSVEYARLR